MRTATLLLAVLVPAALLGAGWLALRAGTAREAAVQPAPRGPESPLPAAEPALARPAPVPDDAPSAGRTDAQASGTREPEPGPRETALIFRVVDGRNAEPLETFEVRAGQGFLRPLLDEQGRIRHLFPQGRVRFPGLIEGRAGESVQLAILARGYQELRLPELYVAPGRELDLGTLRLERAPRLTLQVLDDLTGEPVAGARVSLLAAGNDPPSDERPPLPAGLDPWSARTDAKGLVLLTSRPGETVTLTVRHAEHAPFDAQLLLPLAEEHRRTVRLGALPRK